MYNGRCEIKSTISYIKINICPTYDTFTGIYEKSHVHLLLEINDNHFSIPTSPPLVHDQVKIAIAGLIDSLSGMETARGLLHLLGTLTLATLVCAAYMEMAWHSNNHQDTDEHTVYLDRKPQEIYQLALQCQIYAIFPVHRIHST